MTFLAPAFLVAAGAIGALVVALHFIVTTDPRTVPLPTARFAPARPVSARARALRLKDLLLLAVRVALILAVGAALAKPVVRPARRGVTRVVLVDRSRAVTRPSEVADSVRALRTAGDAVVMFDSIAAVVQGSTLDTAARLERRGRLTTALIAALRIASAMRETSDSFELAIVSPLAAEEFDDATDSVRALWPGAVRLVPIAGRRDAAPAPVIEIDGAPEDPLRFALPDPRVGRSATTVRVARGSLGASDSAWAQAGHVLVYWPSATRGARGARDTVGAVIAGGVVVVAPFVRRLPVRLSARPPVPRVVARWVDGEPAAIEERLGAGCIRTVAVEVPSRGDLVLQPRFGRFVAALTEPCGGRVVLEPVAAARRVALAGAGAARAPSRAFASPEMVPMPAAPWLLAAALVLSALELLVRRPGAARSERA